MKSILVLASFLVCLSLRGAVFPIKGTSQKIFSSYYRELKKFSRKVCTPGTEEKYHRLYRDFLSGGFYVPIEFGGGLDSDVIKKYLPLIKEKEDWIKLQILSLRRVKNFSSPKKILRKMEKDIIQLLRYKKKYYQEARGPQKKDTRIDIEQKSRESYINLRKTFGTLLEEIGPFLSFKFPLDHYDLRSTYDLYKNIETKEAKKKSNDAYFYRKIVEDGAQTKSKRYRDNFLRANLNTLFLSFQEDHSLLPEDIRYDFKDASRGILKHIKKGKIFYLRRLNEWLERTQRQKKFYKGLLAGKVIVGKKSIKPKDFLAAQSQARFSIKQYNLKKQMEVYEFWKKRPEYLRALFVLETILMNEVGSLDGSLALERKDVAQVVINRNHHPEYHTLSKEDHLLPFLNFKKNEYGKFKWLNSLLKTGEFSFSYFFISGSVRIYCHEKTKRGRYLRRRNLKISLSHLRNPRYHFKAVRYFSRASMLGRIDMSPIWKNFKALEQRVGPLAKRQRYLGKNYRKGRYSFVDDFTGEGGRQFRVIQMYKKKYIMPYGKIVFYTYRNPHYFRFFAPNKTVKQ